MRRHHSAALLPAVTVLVVALITLTPSPATAQADNGNTPFVGIWKLNPDKSHLPALPAGVSVYREYEDHGDGWMYHTLITVTPIRTDFLFTAARYDGKQYPVYDAEHLGNFIRNGAKTARTVEFTRIHANRLLWGDRVNGKATVGGVCIVSADGNTLTITNQVPGQATVTEQVFDRVSAGNGLAQGLNSPLGQPSTSDARFLKLLDPPDLNRICQNLRPKISARALVHITVDESGRVVEVRLTDETPPGVAMRPFAECVARSFHFSNSAHRPVTTTIPLRVVLPTSHGTG